MNIESQRQRLLEPWASVILPWHSQTEDPTYTARTVPDGVKRIVIREVVMMIIVEVVMVIWC